MKSNLEQEVKELLEEQVITAEEAENAHFVKAKGCEDLDVCVCGNPKSHGEYLVEED